MHSRQILFGEKKRNEYTDCKSFLHIRESDNDNGE